MSRILTAAEIATRALRAMGQFPITDNSPDPAALAEAMRWLDMLMAETAGTERLFSRVTPTTLSLTLTNGTSSYDFYAALGSQLPTDRLQFIVDMWLEDGNGNRFTIDIVTRERFEDVDKPAETGQPRWVYIDRAQLPSATPTLRIFPTPASTDTTVWTLKMVGQRYAPNVAPGGVTGTLPLSSVLHDFGQAWQRWLVLANARDISSGPVQKLPQASIDNFAKMAMEAKTRLLAFENREDDTSPPVCDAPDGWLDDQTFEDVRFTHNDYGNRRGW